MTEEYPSYQQTIYLVVSTKQLDRLSSERNCLVPETDVLFFKDPNEASQEALKTGKHVRCVRAVLPRCSRGVLNPTLEYEYADTFTAKILPGSSYTAFSSDGTEESNTRVLDSYAFNKLWCGAVSYILTETLEKKSKSLVIKEDKELSRTIFTEVIDVCDKAPGLMHGYSLISFFIIGKL